MHCLPPRACRGHFDVHTIGSTVADHRDGITGSLQPLAHGSSRAVCAARARLDGSLPPVHPSPCMTRCHTHPLHPGLSTTAIHQVIGSSVADQRERSKGSLPPLTLGSSRAFCAASLVGSLPPAPSNKQKTNKNTKNSVCVNVSQEPDERKSLKRGYSSTRPDEHVRTRQPCPSLFPGR